MTKTEGDVATKKAAGGLSLKAGAQCQHQAETRRTRMLLREVQQPRTKATKRRTVGERSSGHGEGRTDRRSRQEGGGRTYYVVRGHATIDGTLRKNSG